MSYQWLPRSAVGGEVNYKVPLGGNGMFHILVVRAVILTHVFLKLITIVLCLPINFIVCKCYVPESPGKGHGG